MEGLDVKSAMKFFSRDHLPKGIVAQGELPFKAMKDPAYQLTLALKAELGHAWQKPFSEL